VQGAGRASKTASDIHTQTLRSGFDLSVRMKSGKGPFAHLVRDRAITGYELPFHRAYTVCPEVVEGVSREFEERFGISILERYRKMTAPCIVSFRRGGAPKRLVGDALGYLYCSLRGEDVPAWCDTVSLARVRRCQRRRLMPSTGCNKVALSICTGAGPTARRRVRRNRIGALRSAAAIGCVRLAGTRVRPLFHERQIGRKPVTPSRVITISPGGRTSCLHEVAPRCPLQ
jgi:hypothetical protein